MELRATCLALAAYVALLAGPAEAQFVSDSVAEHDAQMREAERIEREARRAAYEPVIYPKHMDGGERPDIAPAAPPVVYFDRSEEPGSIIIDTQSRKLYFVLPNKQAYEYPVSVGREGFTWTGTQRISRIASWPSWTPPPEMHERVPGLPLTVSGGLKNPQGARALSWQYRVPYPWHQQRSHGRAREFVGLLPPDERARRAPGLDCEGRHEGERAASLYRWRERDHAVVFAVRLRLFRLPCRKAQGEKAGGDQEEASGYHDRGDASGNAARRCGRGRRSRSEEVTSG